MYIKKIQLGFSSKIEVPSLDQISSKAFQLGSGQLELITRQYPLIKYLEVGSQLVGTEQIPKALVVVRLHSCREGLAYLDALE